MFERIIHDPRSHTTHHTITGQQSVGFAPQVVLLVVLLVICTAATVKVVPESLTFLSSPKRFRDFASQELLEVL